MYKTVLFAALGFAAVSAQFLNVRELQTAGVACTLNTTAEVCSTVGFCCASVVKGTTTTTPTQACVPAEFNTQTLTISANPYKFTCNYAATASRIDCTNDTVCAAGTCCGKTSLWVGTAPPTNVTTASATWVTLNRTMCVDGTKNGTINAGTSYAAAVLPAGVEARFYQDGNCVNKVVISNTTNTTTPPTVSFGSYFKVSVMMFVAILSVMFF